MALVGRSREDIISLLLYKEADTNCKSNDEDTALMRAALYGN